MKILLFSDVHANIDALQALESAEKHWDEAWFLGDMVDYGFHPHEVIAWMREHEVKAVMGNHDRRLINEWDSGAPCPPPEAAERFIDYDRALVTAEDIAWLRTLPEERRQTVDGIPYYMAHSYDVHDQQRALEEQVAFRSGRFFEQVWREKMGEAAPGEPRRILYGHTHQCTALYVRAGAMLLNPGSLSYRLGPDGCCKGGSYMLIEDGEVKMRYLTYDTSRLLAIAEASSLKGSEIGNARVFFSPEKL